MNADLIVVGAGPSGLTVAAEVAKLGLNVIVLERREGGHSESRAAGLVPRVTELLASRGVADRFFKESSEQQEWPFHPGHIYGGESGIKWRDSESRFDFSLRIQQWRTEKVLLGWCLDVGVDVRFGHIVEDFGEEGDGYAVMARTSSGEEVSLTAKYLVGADGGRSFVRTKLGIPFIGKDESFLAVVADVVSDYPIKTNTVHYSENGWISAYPIDESKFRFIGVHAKLGSIDVSPAKGSPVTVDEVKRYLCDLLPDIVNVDDMNIKGLSWSNRFGDALRSVSTFRSGRAFLVGEACRIHYPASGVGMNFCLQDAFNLGWKLAYVLKGYSDPSLLDSFESERKPVMDRFLQSIDSQCTLQFTFTEGGKAHRDHFREYLLPLPEVKKHFVRELSGLTHPYDSEKGSHLLSGERLPDFDLILRDGRCSWVGNELHDSEFVLLDLSGENVFQSLNVEAVAPVRVVCGHGSMLPEVMIGVKALLIRPDSYVAWATDTTPSLTEVEEVLSKWIRLP
ncbi:FAD-dependent oxidoreductase [Aestuariicella hydrocarbonica]|uniref:FAD-dependent oxidoreductase n=1 Tax=Pseudomaricurvus hydrocarbonicus TaxID=1470433 RepID=A0A9E5MM59_9GAMM|nr:FAD-dependent oxidoreductase [Aestuariicella hydrocarbonica]NHO66368.1 FAD-dependent oxidoreductase [Aestuariicella hydrocarbonica]